MNKRQQEIFDRYMKSNLTELRECYKSWSDAKEYALWRCKNTCYHMNGYRFRIISYNSMMFSIGYCYIKGNITYIHYETNYTSKDWRI